jgi:6-phosphofructokinase 1
MVCVDGGNLRVVPFAEMRDPKTGRTRVRLVDVESLHYRVAAEYMTRLEQADLEDPEMLRRLSEAANTTPNDFRERYGHAARSRPSR